VTALTGIDAISHAVETFVTKSRNPISLTFSREAWRLLSTNFLTVLQRPDDLAARAAMQLGACLAGLAIENSMLGAAHALANPITAAHGTPHGQAIAVMLPHVVRYNGQAVGPWYAELLASTGQEPGNRTVADWLAHRLTEFAVAAKLATRLRDINVPRDQLPDLAADAAKQWTANHNPRPVSANDLLGLYEQAY
jgi:alcohol dehydrogenase